MYRLILSCVLFFCLATINSAQDKICSSEFHEEARTQFLKNKYQEKEAQAREDLIYVPIKFHLVADVEGDGRVPFDAILDQLCELNTAFEPIGYKFYMKDGTVNRVNNNTIYFNAVTAAGISKMVTEKNNEGSNAINIFVPENADGGGIGTTLGFYLFNQDWIVLKKSVPQNETQDHFVLAHEIGHFFSLPHTFLGWDDNPWDGTPVTSPTSPGGELNELADGSNSDIAGDMIEDTPADYNLGFGWNGCTEYTGGCADITGALLDPQEENFMGYFIGCDQYVFSDKQQEIITNDYNSSRRAYLRVSYQPNDLPIEDLPEIIAPADDSTTPYFNGVELSWTPVENATHYFIELTQGLFKTRYIVESNKLFLTDLIEDKNYRWRVIPYNEINTCSSSSPIWQFRTGTGTTSTNESETQLSKVNIYPNPTAGNEINLHISDTYTGIVESQIIDIKGRLLQSASFNKTQEKVVHKINSPNLSEGFYLVKIRLGDKTITRKVIINE